MKYIARIQIPYQSDETVLILGKINFVTLYYKFAQTAMLYTFPISASQRIYMFNLLPWHIEARYFPQCIIRFFKSEIHSLGTSIGCRLDSWSAKTYEQTCLYKITQKTRDAMGGSGIRLWR